MKQLTIIIICAMLCISASVVSKNVFIPAKPSKFFIKEFMNSKVAIEESKSLHYNGWQNIKITMSEGYSSYPCMIVTAEKY